MGHKGLKIKYYSQPDLLTATSPLLSFALMDSPSLCTDPTSPPLYFFTFLGLCQVVTKGSNTLGDKFQQNVAMTNHSLCTGPAKSCSNTLPRQIIHVYWSLNFCENLCLSNRILLLQPVVKNQMILNLCNLLQGQNSVSETKIFTKIIQYT